MMAGQWILARRRRRRRRQRRRRSKQQHETSWPLEEEEEESVEGEKKEDESSLFIYLHCTRYYCSAGLKYRIFLKTLFTEPRPYVVNFS
jgi:hypothetical protein